LVFSPPPGTSTEAFRSTLATESSESPYRRRFSCEISILISGGGTPEISTCVISGSWVSWSRTCSLRACRALGDACPYSTTVSTLRLFQTIRTRGSSASSGNVVMRSTSALTSWATFLTSAPTMTSAVTRPEPS